MYFYVIHIENLSTLIREFKMIRLTEFLDLGDYVLRPNTRSYETTPNISPSFFQIIESKYNCSQYDSICKINQKITGITLLQGPPGTGKTHTILALLSSFLLTKLENKAKPRVLVCAPSNSAVDEIAVRCIKQGVYTETGCRKIDLRLVRIGNYSAHLEIRQKNPNDLREPPKEIKEIMLDHLISKVLKSQGLADNFLQMDSLRRQLNKFERELEKKKKHLEKSKTEELKEKIRAGKQKLKTEKIQNSKVQEKRNATKLQVLEEADIIFCTLSRSGGKELVELNKKFDFVIVDEACQSIELSNLIPFQFSAKHLVLVGDPMQLPSTTISPNSVRCLYNRSLFERLMLGGTDVIMLEIQYRMTKEICCFPSVHFYNSRLLPAEEIDYRQRPGWIPLQEIVFFNLKTSSEARSYEEISIYNENEAKFIIDLYDHFSPMHRMKLDIGIITPYRRQVRLIKEGLNHKYGESWKKDIEVNTIDGFQGREKDLILFSAVRSGNSIGFLADSRRMNVAITRAKFGLFIVGKMECLERNSD